jgi:hypothetical protein
VGYLFTQEESSLTPGGQLRFPRAVGGTAHLPENQGDGMIAGSFDDGVVVKWRAKEVISRSLAVPGDDRWREPRLKC